MNTHTHTGQHKTFSPKKYYINNAHPSSPPYCNSIKFRQTAYGHQSTCTATEESRQLESLLELAMITVCLNRRPVFTAVLHPCSTFVYMYMHIHIHIHMHVAASSTVLYYVYTCKTSQDSRVDIPSHCGETVVHAVATQCLH